MGQEYNEQHKAKNSRWGALLLCVLGIGLNLGGSWVAVRFSLPLYLDSIGTIISAALGGYVPGVLVGFLSNLINAVNDPINAYYAVLSVLLGVCAAYYAERGYFEKFYKAVFLVFPFSLIGGLLGSILTYLLNGFGLGDGISSKLASAIFNQSNMSLFLSQLSSDMLYDIADKLLVVIAVFLILKMIPKAFRDALYMHGWRQTPLSKEERDLASHTKVRITSLGSKIQMILIAALLFIAAVTTGISYVLYRRATIKDQTQIGTGVAKLAASIIDGDRIDEFIARGEEAEDYLKIERELQSIRSTSDEILYVYVYKIMEDGCHVVFDLDTEELLGAEPGDLIEFDESFGPYLPDLLAGNPIEPLITDDTYGWLLTAYEPIRDSNGVTQAYACVDISMAEVTINTVSFLTKVFALFLGFFIMIIVIGQWFAKYNLILPINTMALAAGNFAYNTEAAREDSVEHFRNLRIETGDEIENLYHSFSMTIEETVRYIASIQEQSQVINRMQNGLILVLADMVESRDQCTGDHVRKTAAYCRIILEQLRKDGLFTDLLTDEYIDDVVNSAPLHDIGKIKVSDAILNKPGKLTDEEFEEMKKHTLAGNEIIQQAMELVSSDTGYLREAKNLATYHHEKWNGKGYPKGLSGEDIPLSARVMAVADVFDALVSRRSYKEPFSFEKAMSIIDEGSGNHFDPRVVKAFDEVKDQAKEISERHLGQSTEEVKPLPEPTPTN